MVNWQEVPVNKNAEVVHPGHPAIIDTGVLADKTKKLKAGTILALDANGKLAAAEAGDDPIAVLTADSDGVNAEVMALWHGVVVRGRLLDSSGTKPVAADDELAFNLRAAGIYPVQSWTSSKKG
jgi:hypothetical protein